ncbi:hypothetical protein H5410_037802, partial [Solanum commersonii]
NFSSDKDEIEAGGVIRNTDAILTPWLNSKPSKQAFIWFVSFNLHPIEVEIDSIEIIQLLEHNQPTYESITLSCRSLLKKLGNLVVRHNTNKVADILAKQGTKLTKSN